MFYFVTKNLKKLKPVGKIEKKLMNDGHLVKISFYFVKPISSDMNQQQKKLRHIFTVFSGYLYHSWMDMSQLTQYSLFGRDT